MRGDLGRTPVIVPWAFISVTFIVRSHFTPPQFLKCSFKVKVWRDFAEYPCTFQNFPSNSVFWRDFAKYPHHLPKVLSNKYIRRVLALFLSFSSMIPSTCHPPSSSYGLLLFPPPVSPHPGMVGESLWESSLSWLPSLRTWVFPLFLHSSKYC